jgi:uncharacterized protein (DUF2062 family)
MGIDMTMKDIWGDVASAFAVVGTIMGWLPGVAALMSAIWFGIQIYESETCQKWRARRHKKRRAKLVAKQMAVRTQNDLRRQ